VEFLEVAEGLGLRLDAMKAWNFYIGYGFLNEPAAAGLGSRLGIFLVVLAVNRNSAAVGEPECEFFWEDDRRVEETDACITVA
jgi:hypothetical protein